MAAEAVAALEASREANLVDKAGSTKAEDLQMSEALNSEMDKHAFLKLLTTQLTNQDPMNPMEDHNFVAQLATFSHLETSTGHTKLLENLNENVVALRDDIKGLNLTSSDEKVDASSDSKSKNKDKKLAATDEVKNFETAEEAVNARQLRAQRLARAYKAQNV